MEHRLISLLSLQLVRFFGLVRSISAVQLDNEKKEAWVLLILGRGFTCILRDEPLASPNLLRPANWNLPRPMRFTSRLAAENYARSIGLLPRKSSGE